LESHAAQIRGAIGEVLGTDEPGNEASETAVAVPAQEAKTGSVSAAGGSAKPGVVTKASIKRGPSVYRYNLGTWTAYHAARIAAGSIAGATRRSGEKD